MPVLPRMWALAAGRHRRGAAGRHRAVRRHGRVHDARRVPRPGTGEALRRRRVRSSGRRRRGLRRRVDKVLGDAIVALFGAPVAHEDDADRAVRGGAGDARHAARFIAEQHRADDVRMRIGINTGEVLVGTLAGTDYTAMGDVVNIASRLQQAGAARWRARRRRDTGAVLRRDPLRAARGRPAAGARAGGAGVAGARARLGAGRRAGGSPRSRSSVASRSARCSQVGHRARRRRAQCDRVGGGRGRHRQVAPRRRGGRRRSTAAAPDDVHARASALRTASPTCGGRSPTGCRPARARLATAGRECARSSARGGGSRSTSSPPDTPECDNEIEAVLHCSGTRPRSTRSAPPARATRCSAA